MRYRRFCFVILFSVFFCSGLWAQADGAFRLWLQDFRSEALQAGITAETVNKALATVKPLPWIIDADRNQPEFSQTLSDYLRGILSPQRIATGRKKLVENRKLLQRIGDMYGVRPQYLVALWGIETYYGKYTGKVPIIDALVTLAYDGRRSALFRAELLNALRIIDAGHISYQKMKGSWAGAMGQVQFMPSSFLRYAVDGNRDGRIDLWQTPEDYFSSAANYLHQVGWQDRQLWGREVQLPPKTAPELVAGRKLSLADWQRLGVRRLNGKDLPSADFEATLLRPEGEQGRAFLVYDNYQALLKWNRAHSFALAVGLLADRLR